MAIRVGVHAEGWDHLILRGYLAKLLQMPEEDLVVDFIEALGRGWQFVEEFLPKALSRFYVNCAQLAVVAIDNDGNDDLLATGQTEDSRRPRHWNHPGAVSPECRFCRLSQVVANARTALNWLPQKPGSYWPIIVTVPVEMIEAWLLIMQATLQPGHGSLHAERELRHNQKRRFYGKPEPTRDDVETKALPLIRLLDARQLASVRAHSHSFDQFASQVDQERNRILGSLDCWQAGDRGGEVH
jgi:hypothetical protein